MDSSRQDQPDSLILGNCLSCRGLVRVPSKAPSDSVVRCPHCSETYRLNQILDQAVPQLEIIEELQLAQETPRVDESMPKVREAFVVPSQLSKGAKRSSRRRSKGSDGSSRESRGNRDSKNGEMENFSQRSKSSSRDSRARRQASGSSARRPAAQRNTTLEMIKVVLGAVLAIPIAYLLLLWVFNGDPLSLGPKISTVAPFLVPQHLRGEIEIEEADSATKKEPSVKDANNVDRSSLPKPTLDPDRVLNPDLNAAKPPRE